MTEENDDPKDIIPLEYEKQIDNLIAKAHDDSAKNDFEAARANLYEVLQVSSESMHKLSEIASQSQHPRSFEVLAKLMDTIVNTNKELLNLQSKIREIDAADTPINEKARTINNNLFVGSTAELQKVLKEMKNNE